MLTTNINKLSNAHNINSNYTDCWPSADPYITALLPGIHLYFLHSKCIKKPCFTKKAAFSVAKFKHGNLSIFWLHRSISISAICSDAPWTSAREPLPIAPSTAPTLDSIAEACESFIQFAAKMHRNVPNERMTPEYQRSQQMTCTWNDAWHQPQKPSSWYWLRTRENRSWNHARRYIEPELRTSRSGDEQGQEFHWATSVGQGEKRCKAKRFLL